MSQGRGAIPLPTGLRTWAQLSGSVGAGAMFEEKGRCSSVGDTSSGSLAGGCAGSWQL